MMETSSIFFVFVLYNPFESGFKLLRNFIPTAGVNSPLFKAIIFSLEPDFSKWFETYIYVLFIIKAPYFLSRMPNRQIL